MAVTLTIDGKIYSRWTAIRVTRSLKRAAAGFDFEIPGELDPPILPFAACKIEEGGELILTGYVDATEIHVEARSTRARISGRSKTMDIIDCMPEHTTSQFNGYKLDAIAKAIARQFGIDAVVGPGADVGAPFADATFELSETGFAYLERLARQRGILLTDDEEGNLVLATLGTEKAPGALVQGQGGNVFRAGPGRLTGQHRFSQYTVYSQNGMKQTGSDVDPAVKAVANDGGVKRFRPWAGIAESSLDAKGAQLRAEWEAAHRAGEAVQATLSVPEWRTGGKLWKINQMVDAQVPRLALKAQFLIGTVDFEEDGAGRRTALTIAPPSAFLPGKLKEKPAKGAGGDPWAGIQPVPPT